MEILIEIGTNEQKGWIEEELGFIDIALRQAQRPIPLKQIIVSSDLEATINRLEGVTTYQSRRNLGENDLVVLGKIVAVKDGFAIVLSQHLYTDAHDTLTRLRFILHELFHMVNKRDFPNIATTPYTTGFYSYYLYHLYDEYASDRFAYSMTEMLPLKSDLAEADLIRTAKGYIDVMCDPHCYNHIKKEISEFRNHADTNKFHNNINQHYDDMATCLIHAFALLDSYPDKMSLNDLSKSPFVNDKTLALIDYFRKKESQHDTNLDDGMDLIIKFMENFGMRWEEIASGPYIHVLDI